MLVDGSERLHGAYTSECTAGLWHPRGDSAPHASVFPVQVLLGLVAAAVSPRGFIRTECAFVTIMEALQLVGLLVADDCAGTLNRAVTYLSYIHISLQPWCYNEWQWAMSEMRTLMHPEAARTARRGEEHKRLVRGLSAAWCVGTLLRLVPCFREPCYYCAQREHFCAFDGSSACTMMGSLHIYWRLPLRPTNYLLPGMWGHFALCFLPTALNGDKYERAQMGLLFATGAAASFVVAFYANPATAFDEGPSLWCIVAIPQHLITYFMALRWRRCAVTKAHI